MKTCNTCQANKVCDHNKWGFENCDNYISDKAVEVVRCKECMYYVSGICRQDLALNLACGDDFCSYGERRDT